MVRKFRFISLCLFVLVFAACRKGSIETPTPVDPPPADQPAWTFYNTTNSKLPDNQVNAIAIAADNTKWIGTANGLAKISGEDWTIFDVARSGLPSSMITALCVSADGSVWVGTDKGLAKITTRGVSVYNTANSKLPVNAIMSLAYDQKNNVTWAGTEQGLVKISGSEWTLYDETQGQLILSMEVDQKGALWLGTFRHFSFQGRVKEFHNGTWQNFNLDNYGYPSTFPYKVAIDKNGEPVVLLSGTSVSAIVRVSNGTITEIPKPSAATGIRSFGFEKEKIWIGGKQLSLLGSSAQQVLEIPGIDHGTLALAIGTDGKKWIGTSGAGLAIYNR